MGDLPIRHTGRPIRLSELAGRVGGTLRGEDVSVRGLLPLGLAGPENLGILLHPRYRKDALISRAGALVLRKGEDLPVRQPVLEVKEPYAALMVLSPLWAPPPLDPPGPGVHPTAVLGKDLILGREVRIGPYCVIGDGVRIGDRTVVHAFGFVGNGSSIGRDGLLYPRVTIREECVIGDEVILHPGVVIGADGFGYTLGRGPKKKIPQVGVVRLGHRVELGANTCVDRSTLGITEIGDGTKLDNLVQVGHNVSIGSNSVIVAQCGLAGSTDIGDDVTMSGQSAMIGHLRVGNGATLGARTGATKDVPPGQVVSGYPALPHREDMKLQALYMRLPELLARIEELERRKGPQP